HGWNGCHGPRMSSVSWLLAALPEPATWLSCSTPENPLSAVASTATEREPDPASPGSLEYCSPADAETNDRPSSPVSRMPLEASTAVTRFTSALPLPLAWLIDTTPIASASAWPAIATRASTGVSNCSSRRNWRATAEASALPPLAIARTLACMFRSPAAWLTAMAPLAPASALSLIRLSARYPCIASYGSAGASLANAGAARQTMHASGRSTGRRRTSRPSGRSGRLGLSHERELGQRALYLVGDPASRAVHRAHRDRDAATDRTARERPGITGDHAKRPVDRVVGHPFHGGRSGDRPARGAGAQGRELRVGELPGSEDPLQFAAGRRIDDDRHARRLAPVCMARRDITHHHDLTVLLLVRAARARGIGHHWKQRRQCGRGDEH